MTAAKQVTLASVCKLLSAERVEDARTMIQSDYPFVPVESIERRYGEVEALRIYLRDGFIDRYSGARLVFPGTLRLIALRLPAEFPYHSNWKMSQTHPAFWELSPTVDHVKPVARGGVDHESNWVTTSMLRNSAKGNWTLEELGWQLRDPSPEPDWDGLLGWFREYVKAHPEVLGENRIRMWERAARACSAAL